MNGYFFETNIAIHTEILSKTMRAIQSWKMITNLLQQTGAGGFAGSILNLKIINPLGGIAKQSEAARLGQLQKFIGEIGANANQTINFSISSAQATAIGNNSLATNSGGTMINAIAGTAAGAFKANNVAAGTLTVAGNGTTSGAITIGAGESADQIAKAVNAASGSTNVNASVSTTAVLGSFAAGSVSLKINAGSTTSGGVVTNSAVTVSATLSSSTDLSGLTAAINAQTGATGITAVADLNAGTISLASTLGKDIGVQNISGATGVTVTGLGTTYGGTGTAATLAAAAAAGDTANVGGLVTFNSSSAFTTATTAAGVSSIFCRITLQRSQPTRRGETIDAKA